MLCLQATHLELEKVKEQSEVKVHQLEAQLETQTGSLKRELADLEQKTADLGQEKVQLQQNNTKLVLTNLMLMNKAKQLEDNSRSLVAKQEDLQHQVRSKRTFVLYIIICQHSSLWHRPAHMQLLIVHAWDSATGHSNSIWPCACLLQDAACCSVFPACTSHWPLLTLMQPMTPLLSSCKCPLLPVLVPAAGAASARPAGSRSQL
jgi:hypothetical protein